MCLKKIREKVKIDGLQFGLRLVKGTTDAISMVMHMWKKYRNKGNKLYFAFADPGKAF